MARGARSDGDAARRPATAACSSCAACPAAPRGKIYEVWVERAGKPLPTDALFDATSAGTATVAVPGSLRGASAVLVTAERLGGARAPTMAPLIAAPLAG